MKINISKLLRTKEENDNTQTTGYWFNTEDRSHLTEQRPYLYIKIK